MEILPSDHRQPPDGHEFPDYEEVFKSSKKINHSGPKSYHTNFKLNRDVTQEKHDQVVPGLTNFNHENSSFNDHSTEASSLNKLNSLSNSDLCAILRSKDCSSLEENKNRNNESLPKLHTRSQSLCDINAFNQRQTEHWTTLAEQRKKGLSKLKGLVIPEPISETEIACAINIPEINSTIIGPIEPMNRQAYPSGASSNPSHIENVKLPLTSPPWRENVSAIPKYSPAFKRKSLQIYNSTPIQYEHINSPSTEKQPFVKKSSIEDSYSETMSFLQASKSLESSPTRSDYSFDYVSPHKRSIISDNGFHHDSITEQFALGNCKNEKDMLDDESDNDSAMSSSQCSFISRPSPPPSPNRSCDSLEYETTPNRNVIREHNRRYSGECRHLKASSIEAINRKNILASAKCRSGKDLKVGSPVINRKLEIEEPSKKSELTSDLEKPTISHNNKLDMLHKVNKAFVNVDSAAKEVKMDTPSVIAEENLVNEKNNSNGANSAINDSSVNTITQVRRPSMESKVPSSIPQLKNKPQKVGQVLKYNKSLSVNDLRKNFEDFGKSPAPVLKKIVPSKPMPVKKTTRSEEVSTSKTHVEKEYNAEKDKKKVVEPSKGIKRSSEPNIITITLHPETPGGSLGITLGGGTDYEIKQVTVHRIRFGSVAYQEGTLTKGDHIISINGNLTEGLTHGEAVEFLKEPLKEVTLQVERGSNDSMRQEISEKRKSSILDNLLKPSSSREQKIANHTFLIQKGGAGLGFSMEGGKDSLDGDVPLVVKRIFPGGTAEKDGRLLIGDEIIAINDICFRNLSRMQAWTLMKKLPEGIISLHIFR